MTPTRINYICERCSRPMIASGELAHPICCMPRVLVRPIIKIRTHPIAKKLYIAECNGQQIIVGNNYDEGTLGLFFPPGIVISDNLLEEMALKGRLSGQNKNVVQERTMATVMSLGLFYGSRCYTIENEERVYHESKTWNASWKNGDDVGAALCLTPSVQEILQKKNDAKTLTKWKVVE